MLVIALIFIPLERLLPLHAEHSSARGHWPNDVVYLLFNGIIIKIALIIVIGTAMLLLHQLVPAGLTQAVRLQPVWLQAMEVLVLADTGFYLSHRAFHAVPFLWRFHSIHHSIEEMDGLAGSAPRPSCRPDPDQIGVVPAGLRARFSTPAHTDLHIGLSVAVAVHPFDTRIRVGPLKWLLASPRFHHWHHANEREAWDKNFAGQLPFARHAGRHIVHARQDAAEYDTDDPVPSLYHRQLAYPFVGDQLFVGNTEQTAPPARLAEASPTSAGKSE
ncbi:MULTISPECIES: sterol desaturase family protein [unclassified Mesorhizobium]|uniref:sterol desaturase family protein n=1 Tax=unclassified Mesorhizobium TaxID=325217 RepID=UPI0012EB3B64|nr:MULTISPECIES: sterol desaturase family protein [unclassified Mesorhizobium]WJI68391.1 sterol desaturase family protein [Mesorhizobium sp. C399B]